MIHRDEIAACTLNRLDCKSHSVTLASALQLVTLGGLGIWMIRDLFLIATGNFTDKRGYRIQRWN